MRLGLTRCGHQYAVLVDKFIATRDIGCDGDMHATLFVVWGFKWTWIELTLYVYVAYETYVCLCERQPIHHAFRLTVIPNELCYSTFQWTLEIFWEKERPDRIDRVLETSPFWIETAEKTPVQNIRRRTALSAVLVSMDDECECAQSTNVKNIDETKYANTKQTVDSLGLFGWNCKMHFDRCNGETE